MTCNASRKAASYKPHPAARGAASTDTEADTSSSSVLPCRTSVASRKRLEILRSCRKAIGRAKIPGNDDAAVRPVAPMLEIAARAQRRPDSRNVRSASGRRPISRAKASTSSNGTRCCRRTASWYLRICSNTVSLSPNRLFRSSCTSSASISASGVSIALTASSRESGRRASRGPPTTAVAGTTAAGVTRATDSSIT